MTCFSLWQIFCPSSPCSLSMKLKHYLKALKFDGLGVVGSLAGDLRGIPLVVEDRVLHMDGSQVEAVLVGQSYLEGEHNAQPGLHSDQAGQGEGLVASHDSAEEEDGHGNDHVGLPRNNGDQEVGRNLMPVPGLVARYASHAGDDRVLFP